MGFVSGVTNKPNQKYDKSGLTELEENHWITLKNFYKEYLVDFSKLKIDTSKEFLLE